MTREARPFQRGAYGDLPDRPVRPHPFLRLPARSVEIASRPFGLMRAAYRMLGSGPPLLLVHGLMTSGYSWRYVIEPLAKRWTVYVPDLPGCGDTEARPERSHAPEHVAQWITEFQDVVGIRGCATVGNSMGGYLCMRAALANPRAFSRLVNIHSPAIPEARLHALRAALSIPVARSILIQWIRRDPYRWAHQNVHYYDERLKSLEEAREYGRPLALPEGAAVFVRYLRETMSPVGLREFNEQLIERRNAGRSFPVPLMLLYATTDPMVPPRIGHALHALVPDAPIVWLDGTSHFAHVDTPERVVESTAGFLADALTTAAVAP